MPIIHSGRAVLSVSKPTLQGPRRFSLGKCSEGEIVLTGNAALQHRCRCTRARARPYQGVIRSGEGVRLVRFRRSAGRPHHLERWRAHSRLRLRHENEVALRASECACRRYSRSRRGIGVNLQALGQTPTVLFPCR